MLRIGRRGEWLPVLGRFGQFLESLKTNMGRSLRVRTKIRHRCPEARNLRRVGCKGKGSPATRR
jgi:hypothetical protein